MYGFRFYIHFLEFFRLHFVIPCFCFCLIYILLFVNIKIVSNKTLFQLYSHIYSEVSKLFFQEQLSAHYIHFLLFDNQIYVNERLFACWYSFLRSFEASFWTTVSPLIYYYVWIKIRSGRRVFLCQDSFLWSFEASFSRQYTPVQELFYALKLLWNRTPNPQIKSQIYLPQW